MSDEHELAPDIGILHSDLRKMIEEARERTATAVNREMTLLYWNIGSRIRKDILGENRAEYGRQVVATLSRQLTAEFGRGFSESNLKYMIQFAETFPDLKIRQSLIGELSWTHFLQLLPIEDRLKREFYAEMCRLERWSVRTLRSRIGGMLFERTTLSGKAQAACRDRTQTRQIHGGIQRADGALSSLAGSVRTGAR